MKWRNTPDHDSFWEDGNESRNLWSSKGFTVMKKLFIFNPSSAYGAQALWQMINFGSVSLCYKGWLTNHYHKQSDVSSGGRSRLKPRSECHPLSTWMKRRFSSLCRHWTGGSWSRGDKSLSLFTSPVNHFWIPVFQSQYIRSKQSNSTLSETDRIRFDQHARARAVEKLFENRRTYF